MTGPANIAALKRQLTNAGLPSGPLHDALNELERTRAERKSYDELYEDALADAKSDAQDFESDLWIEVRKLLTEMSLDWRDYAEDGILAEQAVEYIRECMDEETRRAETAEADRDRLAGELAEARAALLQAAAEEYLLKHVMEGPDERLGRASAIRGLLVRMGLYADFEQALDLALMPSPTRKGATP